MGDLRVVRLLQNPLGQVAPSGVRGDLVRVSDATTSLYLFPWELESMTEDELRCRLAQQSVSLPGPQTESADAARRPARAGSSR
jgi:hypothetical protein